MTMRIVVACEALDAAIAAYEGLGFRLDMIMPADSPRLAQMSGDGIDLRLEREGGAPALAGGEEPGNFLITRTSADWGAGRAGMQYRDLIPSRLGGRVIASQIRIPDGGPVNDYVHYHRVRFQMIYCRRGWVRVVYEDQGAPFAMHEGDCVLQPSGIRHRVLEASRGLEVIEVSAPAEHETIRDHDLALPTQSVRPERIFEGQRFVRRVAAEAAWTPSADGRFEIRDTGIAEATSGLAGARVLRWAGAGGGETAPRRHAGELLFIAVLEGRLRLRAPSIGTQALGADDACVVPAGSDYALSADVPCQMLEVALPARVA